MTNGERRDSELVYVADGSVLEEMKKARILTQKLNSTDRQI